MEQYTLSALVTIFSALFTFYLAFNVGMTRTKHKERAYEKQKNEQVMIANRAHMNMVEVSVVFLPLLWVATVFSYSTIAGIVGAVWFMSRVWYSYAYLKDPKKREVPFIIGV